MSTPPLACSLPMHPDALHWIQRLGLVPHPEGGYFAETYRAGLTVPQRCLPPSYSSDRRVATAIFYLLTGDDFSAFHRLRSDEIWHFHAGQGLYLFVLGDQGEITTHHMGTCLDLGQAPQAVVPAGSWLAARPSTPDSYALLGCTTAPGFEFDDFELAERTALIRRFPRHRDLIASLTRTQPG